MKQLWNLLIFGASVIFLSQNVNASDDDVIQKLSQANLKFNLDVYKTLTTENKLKTFVTSPFSISTLFSMLLVGAKGTTSQEINNTLGYSEDGIDIDEIKSAYDKILGSESSSLNSLGADVANSVWNSKNFQVNQDYIETLLTSFKAKESSLDFASSDATANINNWVNEKTGGKIPSLFDDPLPASTLLVLVNAIYFKASWKIQFPVSETKQDVFRGEDSNTMVPMMHVKDAFRGYRSQELKSNVLEMEYGNSNTSMVIFLPFQNSNLKEMEAKLSPDALVQCFDNLKSNFPSMDVYLPRFKLEQKYNLIPIMQNLKTSKVFGAEADLSGIANGLYVTQALQKAFVEVNEDGTTAAAASGVSLSRTISPIFKADSPFMFLIRNRANNMISFIGRYA